MASDPLVLRSFDGDLEIRVEVDTAQRRGWLQTREAPRQWEQLGWNDPVEMVNEGTQPRPSEHGDPDTVWLVWEGEYEATLDSVWLHESGARRRRHEIYEANGFKLDSASLEERPLVRRR